MSDTSPASSSGSSTPPSSVSDHLRTTLYHVGFKFRAHRHIPLSPSRCGPRSLYRIPLSPILSDWKQLSQAEACLTRPPLDGTTHKNKFIDLEITAELRTGDQKGAQIVLVTGNLVAKIYDPLYYQGVNESNNKVEVDVVKAADTDYCYEAAAYNELLSTPLPGIFIPEYYSSWVIDVRQGTSLRQVPIILMEFIDGICMKNLDPKLLSKDERNNIMTRALEAETEVFHHGVRHKDLHPRNIVISPSQPSSFSIADLRVVLLDFNIAEVERLAGRIPSKQKRSKMLSPTYRQWGQLVDFVVPGWVPFDNETGTDAWLWERFENDDRFVRMRKNVEYPGHHPELIEDAKDGTG